MKERIKELQKSKGVGEVLSVESNRDTIAKNEEVRL